MNALQQIRKLIFSVVIFCAPTLALAGPPDVVASIKPVQGLVLAVMGEIGEPTVLLPASASPHSFTLKPSQAETLQNADVIFWIGPSLETALQRPLENLSTDAQVIPLLNTPGLDLLQISGDEHGHDHGAIDPHIWLSPTNILIMLDHIRDVLVEINPDNAAVYTKNTKVAKNRTKLLMRQGKGMVAAIKDTPYMVQHDGFGYIARDFGLTEIGYLQTMPGREPGAKHVSAMRDVIKREGVKCLFHEPQFTPALAESLSRELGVRLGVLDPMGTDLTVSPTLHVRIIQSVIVSLDQCLYTPVDSGPQQ